MSRDASVALHFAGEERTFRLPIGRWRAVQEKCDAGPMELLRRYIEGTWRVDDLREVLRQSLIGAGMEDAKVTKLLVNNFDELPLAQFVPLVQAIVMASVVGAPEEAVGEKKRGGKRRTTSRAASSGSPTSTP